MKKCRKKHILSTIAAMIEFNGSVLSVIRSNPQEIPELLMQCQNAALQIGTNLESMGNQYAAIVNALEDYCENIYLMSMNLFDNNACRKLSKKIEMQLTSLQKRIQYEMPADRKEVVFLPYKASMWDSLESVWKAADENKDMDAYVIPIPYYDRKIDGSLGDEHYEGDLYPSYVPITQYNQYDFKNRRPDMIYIHNAYDNANYVTSITHNNYHYLTRRINFHVQGS